MAQQSDVSTIFEFESAVRICDRCGYTRDHLHSDKFLENGYGFFTQRHNTCLCLLFEASVVCCSKGYSNLLALLPSLAIYAPGPRCITSDYTNGLAGGVIVMSRDDYMELAENCEGARSAAQTIYPYLKNTYLPITFETD